MLACFHVQVQYAGQLQLSSSQRSKGKHNRLLKVAVQGLVLWPTPYTYITLHYTFSVNIYIYIYILWRVRVAPLTIAGSGSELLDRFIRQHSNTVNCHTTLYYSLFCLILLILFFLVFSWYSLTLLSSALSLCSDWILLVFSSRYYVGRSPTV
jgi:hypothetical protein